MGRNFTTFVVAIVCLLTGYALGYATARSTQGSGPLEVAELAPAPPERLGRIKIESKPNGARVSVNREPIRLSDGETARTPIEALTQLRYGKQYVLRLEKKGYEPATKSFVMSDLFDGETIVLTLEAKEKLAEPVEPPPTPTAPKPEQEVAVEAGMGLLSVDTEPAAIVHLDDDRLGPTPIAGRKVTAGAHRLRLIFPSLKDHEELKVITVAEKRHMKVMHRMDLAPAGAPAKKASAGAKKGPAGCETIPGRVGQVMLTSDEIAEIYVGGDRRGTTPIKLQLAAGCQIVEAVSVNHGVRTRLRIDVKPGETTRQRIRF